MNLENESTQYIFSRIIVPLQFQRLRYGRNWALTLLYNAEHNLTYCWAHKVASTSWNELFFSLASIDPIKARTLLS